MTANSSVASPEDAEALRFLGSPSVRVDGHDVEHGAHERVTFALGCRVYRTDEGLKPLPAEAWIRAAVGVADWRPRREDESHDRPRHDELVPALPGQEVLTSLTPHESSGLQAAETPEGRDIPKSSHERGRIGIPRHHPEQPSLRHQEGTVAHSHLTGDALSTAP